jgi:hypothetical protein
MPLRAMMSTPLVIMWQLVPIDTTPINSKEKFKKDKQEGNG